jgi:endonuclease/exonuclease/phosphatase family metal-dependent hydrolase
MQSLTVASFNIHWGRRPRTQRPYDVIGACRQIDADVLALQEVWRPDGKPSIAEEIADALGYEFFEVWTGRAIVTPVCRLVGRTGEPVGTGDWGQALLTRVPRGPVTEHRLDGFLFDGIDRAVTTADIELDGGTLTVCASHFPHLEHFSPLLRWRLRGVVPDVHQPAVLMGDFNMWRWVTRFIVPGWRDTVRGATWPNPRPMMQIDHLLTTPPVVVTDAEVVDAGRSDHRPIRARVSLSDHPTAPGP